MTSPQPLLIIVHPGSACGSADMNLGRNSASIQRLDMQLLVEDWQGGVLVIDGDMSDELGPAFGGRSEWQAWGLAIEEALDRARQSGFISGRILGDDASEFNQMDAAKQLVKDYALTQQSTHITLTGAWVDQERGGCVHSVREVLEPLGFSIVISDAMDLDGQTDFDCEDDFEGACKDASSLSVRARPTL